MGLTAPARPWLGRLRAAMRALVGHDVPERQLPTLAALVERLSAEHGATDPVDFLRLVEAADLDARPVQALLAEATNNESYFFRDEPTMASLRGTVLPALAAARPGGGALRIWSAGSSTGEEPYTLAILLSELPGEAARPVDVVGTDVDGVALEHARRGEYRPWSLRTSTDAVRDRYFERLEGGRLFRIRDRYRRGVRFALHNLADPAARPPGDRPFDLVFCRNVTIYFADEALPVAAAQIRAALAPDGAWIAGPSDPLPGPAWETEVLPGLLLHRPRPTRSRARRVSDAPTSTAPRRRTAAAKPLGDGRAAIAAPRSASPVERRPPATQVVPTASPAEQVAALVRRGFELSDAGDLAGAAAAAEEAVARDALFLPAHELSARVAEAGPDPQAALAALRRLVYLAPDSADANFRLGLALHRAGDAAGAARAMRAVLSLPEEHGGGSGSAARLRDLAARRLAEWQASGGGDVRR